MIALQAGLGILVLILFCWALSENRKSIRWSIVVWGLALQFIIALLLLKAPVFNDVLVGLANLFQLVSTATKAGTSFVFGYLGGAPLPFTVTNENNLFIFAINPMMTVFVIAAISGVLWYWGWLPKMISAMAYVFSRTMKVSGSVAFAGCANIFFAMTEVIVMIRPVITSMSRAELLQMMTVGMTTIAGSMFVIYAQFLSPIVPNAMTHVLTSSFIHLPAGLVFAYLLLPHTVTPTKPVKVKSSKELYQPSSATSTLEAFYQGALSGIPVVVNCLVILVAVLATLYLVDYTIGGIFNIFGMPGITLAKVLAPVFAPLAWFMGMPLQDIMLGGEFLGTKTVVNEFVALINFSQLPAGTLTEGSALALAYSMVSFANIGTAGIMAAALYAIIPERQTEVAPLIIKCILSGLLATCCTGSVISILYSLGLV